MPPPRRAIAPDAECISFNAVDSRDAELAMTKLLQSDAGQIMRTISTEFVRYVEYKLVRHLAERDVMSRLDTPFEDFTQRACEIASALSLLYAGTRSGHLRIKLDCNDLSDGEMGSRNDASVPISSLLNGLSELVGEKQASQMFRRLQTITDNTLSAIDTAEE